MARVTEQEFTAFVQARGDALLRVAYTLTGDQHAAEDLLQTALAKAYARWPRIRGDAESYVRRILYHDQVSGFRRPGRHSTGGAEVNHESEQLLRRAISDLAAEAVRPPDLVRDAVARGRRIRRRRQVTGAAVVLGAVAVIAAPFVLLSPEAKPRVSGPVPSTAGVPTTTAPATTAPATAPVGDWRKSPIELPGGWVVTGATTTGGPKVTSYILDRSRSRYVSIKAYDEVWAAPAGDIAAVFDYDRYGETGLLDVRTGKVRWIRTGPPILTPQWSPDGTRLLLTLMDKETGTFSFGIVTAADGGFRTYEVDREQYFCTDWCQFTWQPDGKEVALPQTDRNAPRSESASHPRRGVQLFSADDGRPTRLVPVRGNLHGATAWSPDGRLVVIDGQHGPQLVEVDSGRIVRALPTRYAHWVSVDRLFYLHNGDAVLIDRAGNEIERRSLPRDLLHLEISVAPR